MGDYRTGKRSSSIFSDDHGDGRNDGSRSDSGRETSRQSGVDDRGFFDKAGDEVRSWFGDEDAEERRDRDARRYEQEHGTSGRYQGGGHEDQRTGSQTRKPIRGQPRSNQARATGTGQDEYGGGAFGDGGFGGGYSRSSRGQTNQARSHSARGSHHDESYRRWREQQIDALDREYDEYCRHRQQQFEQDFSSFRQTRQSGITSGGPTMSRHGAAPEPAGHSAQEAGTATDIDASTTTATGESKTKSR